MGSCHQRDIIGDDRGVGAQRRDLTPIDPHNRLTTHRLIDPWGGSSGGGCQPTLHAMRIDPRTHPAASCSAARIRGRLRWGGVAAAGGSWRRVGVKVLGRAEGVC
jgi:hypothetical protein